MSSNDYFFGTLPIPLLYLNRMVLLNKFVDPKVATTNSDHDLVLISFNIYSFGSEHIDSFLLSDEVDSEI